MNFKKDISTIDVLWFEEQQEKPFTGADQSGFFARLFGSFK